MIVGMLCVGVSVCVCVCVRVHVHTCTFPSIVVFE